MPSSRGRLEEPFVLNGMLSLVAATVYLFLRRDYLLEYFYFNQLLGATHLVTLGFLTSLMMGVLHRLAPMSFHVEPDSRLVSRLQFGLYALGTWGMISHFFLGELTGMSWSTFLVWLASLLQIWNFRGLFSPRARHRWSARFVAASLVYFSLAASVGVLLGLVKGYGLRAVFFSDAYLDNVFAHAHLAAVGWVVMMIVGFQLQLVPATVGHPASLPIRFALLNLGTLGLTYQLFAEGPVAPFAAMIALACLWQAAGPVRSFLSGRAREWELLPLLVLVATALTGLVLSLGWPAPEALLRSRLQLVYGFAGLYGFMVLTVTTIAFKLFPMWVWKERFEAEFGRRPVPGMKELHSETLRVVANVGIFTGVWLTAAGVLASSASTLTVSMSILLAGVAAFVANFVRVARWGLLKLEYRPSPADEAKFREMFPDRA